MAKLPDDVVKFFHSQHFTIVSTVDPDGMPHISCKGIVQIDPDGTIYLLDLYTGKTRANLERNPAISLSAVDEHKFKGYSLDRKSTRLNSSHSGESRMPSSA